MLLADVQLLIRASLGAPDDSVTWTDDLLAAALRSALRGYERSGPIHERSLAVTVAGYEQDLSGIPDISAVVGLAWPWLEDSIFERVRVGYRLVGGLTVRLLERGRPFGGEVRARGAIYAQLGDVLRVRYRKLATVQDLDEAAATNLSAAALAVVVVGAGGHACRLRALALAEDPSTAPGAVTVLERRARSFLDDYEELLTPMSAQVQPSWPLLGL